jgi:hypothetical protein
MFLVPDGMLVVNAKFPPWEDLGIKTYDVKQNICA